MMFLDEFPLHPLSNVRLVPTEGPVTGPAVADLFVYLKSSECEINGYVPVL